MREGVQRQERRGALTRPPASWLTRSDREAFGETGYSSMRSGGTERPFVGDADKVDAARGILRLQHLQARLEVDVLGQPRAERLLVERHGGGKQQRLQQPQVFRAHLGLGLGVLFLGPRLELL